MRVQWVALGAALLAASFPAAGDAREPSDPAARTLAAFRKGARVVFTDCPDEACLSAALAACSPVHLRKKISTVEGSPAVFDYFVVKRAAGCRVVTFCDYTKDYWGGCVVRRQVCPTLEAAQSDDPQGQGCSASEVLFTAKVCRNPTRGP